MGPVLGSMWLALWWSVAAGCSDPPVAAQAKPARENVAADNDRTDTSRLPVESVAAEEQASTPAPPAAVVDATFDDIKFDMEKTDPFDRSLLTPKAESLFGKRIKIRGYMYPTMQRRGLKQFVLVRDNQECCFGPGAALYDCILVHMVPGNTAEYSILPVAVEGRFSFEELPGPDGNPLAIYRLDGENVE